MTQGAAKESRYLADFQEFEKSLAAGEPEWLGRTRRQALARFADLGFPTARRGNEKWKYTSVVPIAGEVFEYAFETADGAVAAADLQRVAPWHDGWASLVFVNGRYSRILSSASGLTDGVQVSNLADIVAHDGHIAEKHLTRYASYEDDAFTALNTAFLRDGAIVQIPDETCLDRPLHLLFLATGEDRPTVSHPRVLVVAGKGSSATLIESYVSVGNGRHFTNSVVELVLEESARLDHYRLLAESPEAFHINVTRVHQGENSTFASTSLVRGSALARYDLQVLLDAPGSRCDLHGLYMTSGTQHVDNYINIDHARPHTTSRLYYKGILDGKSKAVFGGTVLVRKDAQKAEAHQSDKNLVLSAQAELDSKPSLLIYADDVKCGHGATAGNIDEDTVFYMKSRGLDEGTASRLLIHGFASEIIETIANEPLRAYVDPLFLGALREVRLWSGA